MLGPETGLKHTFSRDLIKQLDNPELHTFYADEISLSELGAVLYNQTLFASSVAVIVKNAERIRAKSDLALLKEYIRSESPSVLLILDSDTISISPELQGLFRPQQKKIFWELFDSKKIEWIFRYCEVQHRSIERDAAEMIVQLVEGTTLGLEECLERLFAISGEHISLDAVEHYVYHSRHETVFALCQHLASADVSRALSVLRSLLRSYESPASVLARVLWQYRKLEELSSICREGVPIESALDKIAIKGKRNRATFAKLLHTVSSPSRSVALLAEADIMIRSEKEEFHRGILELLVYHLIQQSDRFIFVERPDHLLHRH